MCEISQKHSGATLVLTDRAPQTSLESLPSVKQLGELRAPATLTIPVERPLAVQLIHDATTFTIPDFIPVQSGQSLIKGISYTRDKLTHDMRRIKTEEGKEMYITDAARNKEINFLLSKITGRTPSQDFLVRNQTVITNFVKEVIAVTFLNSQEIIPGFLKL